MKAVITSVLVLIASFTGLALMAREPQGEKAALIEHGRYLVRIAGCNDCHTPGYYESEGAVDEARWLTGDALGWQGPWGTTYAANLRLYMRSLTEQQWLVLARAMKARPPMPYFNLQAMSDRDLRAIYHFTRALGPAGEPAPTFLPPGKEPAPPVVELRTH